MGGTNHGEREERGTEGVGVPSLPGDGSGEVARPLHIIFFDF